MGCLIHFERGIVGECWNLLGMVELLCVHSAMVRIYQMLIIVWLLEESIICLIFLRSNIFMMYYIPLMLLIKHTLFDSILKMRLYKIQSFTRFLMHTVSSPHSIRSLLQWLASFNIIHKCNCLWPFNKLTCLYIFNTVSFKYIFKIEYF